MTAMGPSCWGGGGKRVCLNVKGLLSWKKKAIRDPATGRREGGAEKTTHIDEREEANKSEKRRQGNRKSIRTRKSGLWHHPEKKKHNGYLRGACCLYKSGDARGYYVTSRQGM